MKKSLVKYPFLTREVEIYELDNGHKIVLAHKEGDMINVSSWVKTGSINENDKNNGISHFLEHLMFKGTHKHKAGEFDHILESRGALYLHRQRITVRCGTKPDGICPHWQHLNHGDVPSGF